ncbi:hypothetical protein T11_2640 [Trichinella zimbabwensis]|uniref:Uncharacterized protein n=1 Tax=Trichinella zimbabwensis TaxID=268475 RepID=A0A0V1GAS4_9BILA|nr:hypothetical protein T11_2640 [Trichinella zimbabwensis]
MVASTLPKIKRSRTPCSCRRQCTVMWEIVKLTVSSVGSIRKKL